MSTTKKKNDPIDAFNTAMSVLHKETSEGVFQSLCVCRRVYTGYLDNYSDFPVSLVYKKVLEDLGLFEFELTSRESINNFVRDCKRIDDAMNARVAYKDLMKSSICKYSV